MGLDFNKPTTTATPATASIPTAKEEIAVVEQYDIAADRQQMSSELVNSEEVDRTQEEKMDQDFGIQFFTIPTHKTLNLNMKMDMKN